MNGQGKDPGLITRTIPGDAKDDTVEPLQAETDGFRVHELQIRVHRVPHYCVSDVHMISEHVAVGNYIFLRQQ